MNRVEITVVNATPLLVGWYKPEIAYPQGIRATEIKGIWRWWARAFVGGALFDLGLLDGIKTENVLLTPSKDDVRRVVEVVGKELGLGMAIGGISQPSKFSIVVKPLEGRVVEELVDKWKNAQRIRLLGLKIKEEQKRERKPEEKLEKEEPKFEKLPFKLIVEWSKDFDYRDIAIKTLLVALQLSGVGKGSRRGLGSLDVVSIESSDQKLKSYLDLPEASLSTNKIDKLSKLIEEVYNRCCEIVKKKYKSEEECGKGEEVEEDYRMPPFPVISRKRLKSDQDSVEISKIRVFSNVFQDKFVDVHNFFVRSERCYVLYRNYRYKDRLRQQYLAWFLGLPRAQKGTGYFIKSGDVSRRASPVVMSFHTERNLFGRGAFVSTFISGDWPLELEWSSGKDDQRTIEIDKKNILNAYRVFYDEFETYVRNRLGNISRWDVWPPRKTRA